MPARKKPVLTCSLRLDAESDPAGEWVVILYRDGIDVGDRWNHTLAAAVVVMEMWIRNGVALSEISLNN